MKFRKGDVCKSEWDLIHGFGCQWGGLDLIVCKHGNWTNQIQFEVKEDLPFKALCPTNQFLVGYQVKGAGTDLCGLSIFCRETPDGQVTKVRFVQNEYGMWQDPVQLEAGQVFYTFNNVNFTTDPLNPDSANMMPLESRAWKTKNGDVLRTE